MVRAISDKGFVAALRRGFDALAVHHQRVGGGFIAAPAEDQERLALRLPGQDGFGQIEDGRDGVADEAAFFCSGVADRIGGGEPVTVFTIGEQGLVVALLTGFDGHAVYLQRAGGRFVTAPVQGHECFALGLLAQARFGHGDDGGGGVAGNAAVQRCAVAGAIRDADAVAVVAVPQVGECAAAGAANVGGLTVHREGVAVPRNVGPAEGHGRKPLTLRGHRCLLQGEAVGEILAVDGLCDVVLVVTGAKAPPVLDSLHKLHFITGSGNADAGGTVVVLTAEDQVSGTAEGVHRRSPAEHGPVAYDGRCQARWGGGRRGVTGETAAFGRAVRAGIGGRETVFMHTVRQLQRVAVARGWRVQLAINAQSVGESRIAQPAEGHLRQAVTEPRDRRPVHDDAADEVRAGSCCRVVAVVINGANLPPIPAAILQLHLVAGAVYGYGIGRLAELAAEDVVAYAAGRVACRKPAQGGLPAEDAHGEPGGCRGGRGIGDEATADGVAATVPVGRRQDVIAAAILHGDARACPCAVVDLLSVDGQSVVKVCVTTPAEIHRRGAVAVVRSGRLLEAEHRGGDAAGDVRAVGPGRTVAHVVHRADPPLVFARLRHAHAERGFRRCQKGEGARARRAVAHLIHHVAIVRHGAPAQRDGLPGDDA